MKGSNVVELDTEPHILAPAGSLNLLIRPNTPTKTLGKICNSRVLSDAMQQIIVTASVAISSPMHPQANIFAWSNLNIGAAGTDAGTST
ncbi:hypothetical protein [Pseudomonas sp. PDM25]|uniref:hypothetical protein n=1 Tax=Pseudomonas sp. PDM25 TaxID=2854772 RepID=UPI001C47EEFA|nr:hypothetical protein [Pseudomonas sp. PDM25]MBV7515625.1 hypothetical protein [Pseudomonas sp. PDM25]